MHHATCRAPPSPSAVQVYLVGDPVQLPATVISSTALEQGYDVSMFKRLQASGYPVNVLDVQYRMHPAISAFPSAEFYQGRLKDGEVGVGGGEGGCNAGAVCAMDLQLAESKANASQHGHSCLCLLLCCLCSRYS